MLSRLPGFLFGIDRLAVGFELENFNSGALGWKYKKQSAWPRRDGIERVTDRWEQQRYIDGGSRIFVSVTMSETGSVRCYLDFNPARIFDPHGTALAPVESLPALLRCVIYEHLLDLALVPTFDSPTRGRRWLAPDPMTLVVVKHLDVARDSVGLLDPGVYVHAAYYTDQPNAKRRKAEHSKHGRLQSMTAGNGSGEVGVYDKSEEAKARKRKYQPQPGTLRVEARFREGWLTRFGLRTLDQMTPEAVEAAFSDRADWVGVTRPVSGPAVVLDLIDRIDGIKPTTRSAIKGYLLDRTLGRDPGLPRETVRSYDRHLTACGLPSAHLLSGSSHLTRRLDIDRGIEVYPRRRRTITRTPRSLIAVTDEHPSK